MVNASGSNQFQEKEYPSDDVLLQAFEQYARENGGAGLEWKDQIARLAIEFGLHLKKTSLYKLRKRIGVLSVRKNKSTTIDPTETIQAIIDIKSSDVTGRWGVAQVKQRLANEGTLIPRDNVRTVLHDHFDEEFAGRFVGSKRAKKIRTPLNSLGPWHQEHQDGHEKMAEQGLSMGKGIHLPIYASKDQFSAYVHALVLMPKVRTAMTMAHYYLDLVESRGNRISLQLTTDKGTEVDEMLKIHDALRSEAAPKFHPPEWPPYVKITSTGNTPIESFWRWQREGEGHTLKYVLQAGSAAGWFSPVEDIQVHTFYWLWVPLIQQRLDLYREYWNNHRLSPSKGKLNPSKKSPRHMLVAPHTVSPTARDCSIGVNHDTLLHLREAYGGEEARDAAFRFVTNEFQAEADNAYVQLGSPTISVATGWDIFRAVVKILEVSHVE